jgi:Ca-activated chloride channel family protein
MAGILNTAVVVLTFRAPSIVLLALIAVAPTGRMAAQAPESGDQPAPTFRSSVDLVSVSAVVRDRQGRFVKDLSRDDFEVFDDGIRRKIVEFSPSEDGPVSVAILLDTSGSMGIWGNLDAAREVVEQVLALLRPRDEAALYTFDSGVQRSSGFTSDAGAIRQALSQARAFGATAIYDAVAHVAEKLEERPTRRRAVIVVTDGLDTSSKRSVPEVSGIASGSDVPVYVITVGLASAEEAEHAGFDTAYAAEPRTPAAHLGNLAYWTGGALYNGRGLAASNIAARNVLAELRHQYLLAFESAGPGWRPVDVRLRRGQLTVRARSAYQSSHPLS